MALTNSNSAENSGWLSSTKPKISTPNRKNISAVTESLPLDWTRMKRKRTDDQDYCRIRSHRTLTSMPLTATAAERVIHGHAIFCLHDTMDPSWFQGYFLPKLSVKPWGILAVQEEIDECLACESGGYRRLALKIKDRESKSILKSIDWTGGDMMRLSSDKIEMETERLLTGTQALPYLKKYFAALMKRILEDEQDGGMHEQNVRALDCLPDLAIAMGPMSIVLPKKEQAKNEQNELSMG